MTRILIAIVVLLCAVIVIAEEQAVCVIKSPTVTGQITFQSENGNNTIVAGRVNKLQPSQDYGLFIEDSTFTSIIKTDENGELKADTTEPIPLQSTGSIIGKELKIRAYSSNETVAKCVVGIRSVGDTEENSASADPNSEYAVVELLSVIQGNNKIYGLITFQKDDEEVTVKGTVCGLNSDMKYPIYVHEFGDISTSDSVGRVVNTDEFEVTADGIGTVETTAQTKLGGPNRSLIGRSVVITDKSVETGKSGAALARGVVRRVRDLTDFTVAPKCSVQKAVCVVLPTNSLQSPDITGSLSIEADQTTNKDVIVRSTFEKSADSKFGNINAIRVVLPNDAKESISLDNREPITWKNIKLEGENSIIGSTLRFQIEADKPEDSILIGACSVGIANSASSVINTAAYSTASAFAACDLLPVKTDQLESKKITGRVLFKSDAEAGTVTVSAVVCGLPASSAHGFHIHEFGDLSGASLDANVGSHFDPLNKTHSLDVAQSERHVGDMGNLEANATGVAIFGSRPFDLMTLGSDKTTSIIGRSVVIHQNPDDGSQPVGNAGAKIATCVIRITAEELKPSECASPTPSPTPAPTTTESPTPTPSKSSAPAPSPSPTDRTKDSSSSFMYMTVFILVVGIAAVIIYTMFKQTNQRNYRRGGRPLGSIDHRRLYDNDQGPDQFRGSYSQRTAEAAELRGAELTADEWNAMMELSQEQDTDDWVNDDTAGLLPHDSPRPGPSSDRSFFGRVL